MWSNNSVSILIYLWPIVPDQECLVVVKTYLYCLALNHCCPTKCTLIDTLLCLYWSDFKQSKVNQPLYIAPDLWLMTVWLLQNKMSSNVSHLLRNICMYLIGCYPMTKRFQIGLLMKYMLCLHVRAALQKFRIFISIYVFFYIFQACRKRPQ